MLLVTIHIDRVVNTTSWKSGPPATPVYLNPQPHGERQERSLVTMG